MQKDRSISFHSRKEAKSESAKEERNVKEAFAELVSRFQTLRTDTIQTEDVSDAIYDVLFRSSHFETNLMTSKTLVSRQYDVLQYVSQFDEESTGVVYWKDVVSHLLLTEFLPKRSTTHSVSSNWVCVPQKRYFREFLGLDGDGCAFRMDNDRKVVKRASVMKAQAHPDRMVCVMNRKNIFKSRDLCDRSPNAC